MRAEKQLPNELTSKRPLTIEKSGYHQTFWLFLCLNKNGVLSLESKNRTISERRMPCIAS